MHARCSRGKKKVRHKSENDKSQLDDPCKCIVSTSLRKNLTFMSRMTLRNNRGGSISKHVTCLYVSRSMLVFTF